MSDPVNNTNAIKEKARALGFDACGIARADALESLRPLLRQWLELGYQGNMRYMANHFEKRLDPRLILPGAQSVVVVALNYFPSASQKDGVRYRVSRYAYGEDYHYVIKDKLRALADHVTETAGEHTFRCFTDSAPVMERSWARQAGLGAAGKNSCLIIPGKGSFFFLGELVTTAQLVPDQPLERSLCTHCSRCIDACPTKAIVAPGTIDAKRCISYLTIELKDPVPAAYRDKCEGWVFGCDICQEVCPYNRKALPHNEPRLQPHPFITGWDNRAWENLDEQTFIAAFRKGRSPVARIGFGKLRDNILCASTQAGGKNAQREVP